MERGKQTGSSFTSDLFGSKGSSVSSSSGILDSISPPPAKVPGQASSRPMESEKKNESASVAWGAKTVVQGNNTQCGEGQGSSITSKDTSLGYQDERVRPFHYSSSIYYGGQDVYSSPKSTQSPELTTFVKDGKEDDSGSASRGNWWQGSLYY